MGKQIKIFDGVSFWVGDTEAEEKEGFNEQPEPCLQLNGKVHSIDILVNKDQYESFTEELFWLLVSEGKLRCPRCGSNMDHELNPGDPSVGEHGYELANCLNENCYFSDIDTEEKKEELIREIFPMYWRWKEKTPEKKTTLNIYEVFAEHLRTHKQRNDTADTEILSNPLSGICPFCKKTLQQVYEEEKKKSF